MVKTLEPNQAQSEFARLLDESFSYSFRAADLVKGTVVKMDNKEILLIFMSRRLWRSAGFLSGQTVRGLSFCRAELILL